MAILGKREPLLESTKPVVSTMSSCYHGEKYLPLFLERLPEQTAFDRLEVVMDLNEPSEEELHLVHKFQEEYPGHLRYTVQPKVVTYSASWNNCIRNSTGTYMTVWSIDDLRPRDSIEAEATYLDQHPDVGLVYGNEKMVPRFGDEEGPILDVARYPAEMATRLIIFGAFYMFRKELINKAGYMDEQFRSAADFDHCVRLALHTRYVPLDKILGYYLYAGQGLSSNPNSPGRVEDFVISLRYGVYDRLWYSHLALASRYDLYKVLNGDEWIPVDDTVPDFQEMLARRYRLWFDRGYLDHLKYKLTREGWSGIRGVMAGLGGKEG